MNVNGGANCRMVQAVGYSRTGGGEELVSGIWTHAVPLEFEYDEDSIVVPDPMPKFTAYKPVGIIKQVPACRLDYKGKGSGGGRKCPRGYIGAAHRHMRHGESIRVYFAVNSDKVTLGLGTGSAWAEVLREALVAKIERRDG